ncbi:Type 1 glutamine amidotransferase-like domain-containing protein [Dinghuibacter silviterrae]|uniref:Peptidase E n=1 Tax=Dinghuibacter silviterrae TaxID=1539049 RepID=A0A4R8DIM7_9BACT|nr:peptidase E [Dinghuibacter silviterrae]TDW97601.1 peptidase E [Dinghuibacter silviterrae]
MRQIIAMGGGGFSMEPGNPLLDQYVLNASGRSRPSVCFLPHATDDASRYALNFYTAFARLDARPFHLSLFTPPTADLESFLLGMDVIYVGGGNTKSMLALWREWGLDTILRKAYDKGIVLAGISAGANCWFQECSTDSIPGPYTMLPCLGLVPGSFCPHYDGEVERRPSLHRLLSSGSILPGYAADNSAAVHFADDAVTCVASVPSARVYRVGLEGRVVVEEALPTRYLGA